MSVAAAYLSSTGGPAFGRQPVPGFESVRSDLAAQFLAQVARDNGAYNQQMAQSAVDGAAAGGSALAQTKALVDGRIQETKEGKKPSAYEKWAALLRSSGGVGGLGGGSARRAAGAVALNNLAQTGDVSAPGAITNGLVGQQITLQNAFAGLRTSSRDATKGAIDLVNASAPDYSSLLSAPPAPTIQPVSTAVPTEATPTLRAPVGPTDAEIAAKALELWGPRPKT